MGIQMLYQADEGLTTGTSETQGFFKEPEYLEEVVKEDPFHSLFIEDQ